jgi:hypothetical protein
LPAADPVKTLQPIRGKQPSYSGFSLIELLIIVTALALLFSSFSSPLLSAVFAFALFVIGSFAEDQRGQTAGVVGAEVEVTDTGIIA